MRVCIILLLAAALAAVENANTEPGTPGPLLAEGQAFTDHVTVRNPHDRAVKLTQLDSTCTCTRLVITPELVPPGGTAVLDVAIDTANRSGPQQIRVTAYATDPDLEPIEIDLRYVVLPAVTVDSVRALTDPAQRPDDRAWRDIYKFVSRERPDELHRLRKRIRLASPPEDTPPGGLRIAGVDYAGDLWVFAVSELGNGAWLVTATARDPQGQGVERTYDEQVVIRTNHPRKASIPLTWITMLDREAGAAVVDPLLPPPPPMPAPR